MRGACVHGGAIVAVDMPISANRATHIGHLSGIAALLWGDAGPWYKLAEANGLAATSALTSGMSLIVPAGVAKNTHNASTFKPYDPASILGDTSPTSPAPGAPAKKGNKCGVFGAVLLVAVAVAVAAIVGPAIVGQAAATTFGTTAGGMTVAQTTLAAGLTATLGGSYAAAGSAAAIGASVLGGAAAGIAGSVASQGVGLATGIQNKFDWRGVAMAGLTSGVAYGLGGVGIGGGIAGAGLRGAAANAATQGIAVATGLSRTFNWAGLAAAAIGGAAGGSTRSPLLSSSASAIANAATRSALSGTSFGNNILAALPDVVGSTLGNMVASQISRSAQDRAADKAISDEAANIFELALGDPGNSTKPPLLKGLYVEGKEPKGTIIVQFKQFGVRLTNDDKTLIIDKMRGINQIYGDYKINIEIREANWFERHIYSKHDYVVYDAVLSMQNTRRPNSGGYTISSNSRGPVRLPSGVNAQIVIPSKAPTNAIIHEIAHVIEIPHNKTIGSLMYEKGSVARNNNLIPQEIRGVVNAYKSKK